uniref:Uncharacterized protein n=1 Tax=Salix viminalis TaxID=40686 RepID=A0A6N2KKK5_SALVM
MIRRSSTKGYLEGYLLCQEPFAEYRSLSQKPTVQTSLKTKIEAQGRFLERIVEENRNRRASINPIPKHSKSFSPVSSQPSLCDESESNARNFSQS